MGCHDGSATGQGSPDLPAMPTSELFLIALFLIFSVPYLTWRLAGSPLALPLVVVQIVAGILLGPGVAGAVWPDVHAALFRPEVLTALGGIAWWGVILFVFLAGLELDLRETWAARGETLTVAGLALVVPLAVGTAAGAWLISYPGWTGPAAAPWQVALGLGMACAVTALPILIMFLSDLGLLRTPLGQRVLRYASLDDLAIWAVLAFVLLDWERVGRQAAFLCLFLIVATLMRKVMCRLPARDRWPMALVWLVMLSFAADWAGLHYMVGAFLAGLVLDAEEMGLGAIDEMHRGVLLVLMPVFFLSTGLRTTWEVGGLAVAGAALLLLAAAIAGKLFGVALAGRLLGWQPGEAWVIGWLLQTKALIMIVFANILLDRQVITSAAFTALLLMALGSTVLTMPVVARALGRAAFPLAPSRPPR